MSLSREYSGAHLVDPLPPFGLECAVIRWWAPGDERAGRRREIQSPLENAMVTQCVSARKARLNSDRLTCGSVPIQPAAVQHPPTSIPKLTAWQFSAAKRFMLERLPDRLSIGEVASALALSKSYFVRSFTNTMGVAPYNWLVGQRINEARELLTHTTIPLAQIALECGFTDQSHFTNAFRRWVGTTPSKWRRAGGLSPSCRLAHQNLSFPRRTLVGDPT